MSAFYERAYNERDKSESGSYAQEYLNYFLSADGLLMPAKKDQAPPDLRYFK